MNRNTRLNVRMTEAEMKALAESADPGKKSEFIRQAIEWQIAAKAVIRQAVEAKAAEFGFTNPADAFNLADLSAVEIVDGKVTGFEDALEELAQSGSLKMGLPKPANQGAAPLPPVKIRL